MLNVTYQGAARNVANLHFRPSFMRMDILVLDMFLYSNVYSGNCALCTFAGISI